MAARMMPERTAGAKVLPFGPRRGSSRQGAGRRVVAVVLDDGTIRQLASDGTLSDEPFQSGQMSGDRWILWWQRRAFD